MLNIKIFKMRRAYNDFGLIEVEDKFIGVSLGYDHCAEHEWGVRELKDMFGVPEANKENMGVKSRTITKCPTLVFRTGKHKGVNHALLYTGVSWRSDEENAKYTPRDFEKYPEQILDNIKWVVEDNKKPRNAGCQREMPEPVITAWSSSDFGVAVYGDKETEQLKELYEAFRANNVTIAVSNLKAKNPFAGSSLCLLITDRIPKETLDLMYAGDKEYFDREDYEEEIGMKKIIEKYGNKNGYHGLHYFMACSPKWISYSDTEAREVQRAKYGTQYDIMYWVNYSDDEHNYGWFTVEEIREWLTGTKKLSKIKEERKSKKN
jgi:hypothetical protein